ncbi:hypothetical protein Bbelb_190540 [Branchiostoma belcheri]|nr:hypothetical protein Bbelb_190540 [Branchiostoma belcheri]
MEKNELVKIPPRKTRHVRFGAYGKLRLYLTMFLCVLWDLSIFLSRFSEDLSCAPAYSRRIFLCVFLRDLSPIYETREHRTLTPGEGTSVPGFKLTHASTLRSRLVDEQLCPSSGPLR